MEDPEVEAEVKVEAEGGRWKAEGGRRKVEGGRRKALWNCAGFEVEVEVEVEVEAASRFSLHLPEKRPGDFEDQVLVEAVDADHNTILTADFDKLTCESNKGAADDFNIISRCKFLRSDFNFSITVNKQP